MMALRFLTKVTGRVELPFPGMEKTTEGAGLGWGEIAVHRNWCSGEKCGLEI